MVINDCKYLMHHYHYREWSMVFVIHGLLKELECAWGVFLKRIKHSRDIEGGSVLDAMLLPTNRCHNIHCQ